MQRRWRELEEIYRNALKNQEQRPSDLLTVEDWVVRHIDAYDAQKAKAERGLAEAEDLKVRAGLPAGMLEPWLRWTREDLQEANEELGGLRPLLVRIRNRSL